MQGLVGPKCLGKPSKPLVLKDTKGNQVNIPELRVVGWFWFFGTGYRFKAAKLRRGRNRVHESPEEFSFLFNDLRPGAIFTD